MKIRAAAFGRRPYKERETVMSEKRRIPINNLDGRPRSSGGAGFQAAAPRRQAGGQAGPGAAPGEPQQGGTPGAFGRPGQTGPGAESARTGSRDAQEAPQAETAAAARPETTVATDTGSEESARDTAPSTAAFQAAERLAAERDELNEQLLRLRAEFENYRKRTAREQIELRERAQGEMLLDLLPVLDNLERALDAAEHHDEGKVLGGVRMTRDMFLDLLKRAGVEEVETVGSAFDPAVHEAILMQPSDQEEGTVAAVLQRGYRQGDRVLRPARVAVSSGRAGTNDGKA